MFSMLYISKTTEDKNQIKMNSCKENEALFKCAIVLNQIIKISLIK